MFKKITLNLVLISCVLLFITACVNSKVNLTENDSKENTIRVQREAIVRVLDETEELDKKIENSSDIEFVIQILEKLNSISLEGCPPKFTSAYLKFIVACRKIAYWKKDLDAYNERWNSFGKLAECFVRGMVLDFSPITELNQEAEQLKSKIESIDNEISTTFSECLSIAAEYDIDISKYK